MNRNSQVPKWTNKLEVRFKKPYEPSTNNLLRMIRKQKPIQNWDSLRRSYLLTAFSAALIACLAIRKACLPEKWRSTRRRSLKRVILMLTLISLRSRSSWRWVWRSLRWATIRMRKLGYKKSKLILRINFRHRWKGSVNLIPKVFKIQSRNYQWLKNSCRNLLLKWFQQMR